MSYDIWRKNLEFFDDVVLLSRVKRSKDIPSPSQRVDGASVSVHELPDYVGPWEYLHCLPDLRSCVREAIASSDVYLLRLPGLVGRLASKEISRVQKLFAAEIMGDPWDALSPGSVNTLLRPIYRRVLSRDTKSICEKAHAVLYWSQEALQRRYPPGRDALSVVSPEVILCSGFATGDQMNLRFRRILECCQPNKRGVLPLRLGFIGSLEQMYKGPDVLLHAISLCSENGLKLQAFLVGEGRYRRPMEVLASRIGIRDRVTFLGQLDFGKPIFDFLDSVDLFVMPSRAEGFGRALVEAMSRGCPCIGSAIGGIAELLGPEDTVPSGDAKALAAKIIAVAREPERMKQVSEKNYKRAKQFAPEILSDARRAFLRHLRRNCSNVSITSANLMKCHTP